MVSASTVTITTQTSIPNIVTMTAQINTTKPKENDQTAPKIVTDVSEQALEIVEFVTREVRHKMRTNATYFNPKKVPLGAVIKKERQAQEVSQKTLSKRTGIHINSIYSYESGLIEPPFSKFQKLMEALGVDVSILLSIKEV